MSSSSSKTTPVPPGLRILHVASGDLWAGAEVQIVGLLRALQAQGGLDLRAVLMNDDIMAERLRKAGITVDILDESQHSSGQLARGLRALVRAWQPGIVHTHRRKEHVLGALASRGLGARLVGTCHGRSEDLGPGRSMRSRLLGGLQWTVLRRAHDRVVAVSDELAGHLPLAASQVEVICNGIDPGEIRRTASAGNGSPPGDRPVKLGFVGRLVPVKQVDRLLRAMEILERQAPGRFALCMLGDGPLQPELERLVGDLKLTNVVHFLGFRADAPALVAHLDAVAFSSRHEGLPMAALEALALGVPVVAPPVGGLADLLSSSPLGVLAASDEPASLADALLEATSPALEPHRGFPAVPEKYLMSNSAQKYHALYASLASSRDFSPAAGALG